MGVESAAAVLPAVMPARKTRPMDTLPFSSASRSLTDAFIEKKTMEKGTSRASVASVPR